MLHINSICFSVIFLLLLQYSLTNCHIHSRVPVALQMHLEKIRETGPMFSKPLQRSELLALSLQGYDVSEFKTSELNTDVAEPSSSGVIQKGNTAEVQKSDSTLNVFDVKSDEIKITKTNGSVSTPKSGAIVASLLARVAGTSSGNSSNSDAIDLSHLVAGPSNSNLASLLTARCMAESAEKGASALEKPLREYPRTEGVLG